MATTAYYEEATAVSISARSTSAPPVSQNFAENFAGDDWSIYAQQVNKMNPRLPHTYVDPRNGGHEEVHLAQPRARHPGSDPRRNPAGAIGTPVPPSPDIEPQANGLEMGPEQQLTRPKSVVDLIQEDFPRTASPVRKTSHSG